MNEEITVEGALKELRELFPLKAKRVRDGRPIEIDYSENIRSTLRGDSKRQRALIRISYANGDGYSAPLQVEAETLSEAMAQVRAYHGKQYG